MKTSELSGISKEDWIVLRILRHLVKRSTHYGLSSREMRDATATVHYWVSKYGRRVFDEAVSAIEAED